LVQVIVEVAGIEPACFVISAGLLRAQPMGSCRTAAVHRRLLRSLPQWDVPADPWGQINRWAAV